MHCCSSRLVRGSKFIIFFYVPDTCLNAAAQHGLFPHCVDHKIAKRRASAAAGVHARTLKKVISQCYYHYAII